jgi:pimeloyl-ACP methyl ester carboxylesterase
MNLVLVHGITESKASWGTLVESFTRDHQVMAVDLRGHGAASRVGPFDVMTMAADVISEVSAAGVAPSDTVFVGHSLGGMVVSAIAATGQCRAVVNVDQPLQLAAFQAGLQQLEPMLRGDTAAFQAAIAMVFDSMRGPLSATETARLESLRSPEQQVVLGIWDLVLTSPAADLVATVDAIVGAITVPYLALHGIDPGAAYVDWLRTAVPSATVEVWADHGHYPHLVDPARFVARVNSFVASL